MPTAVDEGIEADGGFDQLAFQLASQGLHRRRTGRYWRRAGVGLAGKAVYSGSAFTGAPNGHSMPSRSPSPSQPPRNDLQGERIRPTFVTRSRGWFCRSLSQSRCQYPGSVSDRSWSALGLKRGVMADALALPMLVWYSRGSSPGALGPAVIAGHVTWNGPPVSLTA